MSAPTTSCVITGLANGTPHTFTVVASLGSRASSPSSPSAPIAPGPIPTRPPRPATGTPPPITVSIGGDSVSAPIALSRGRFQPGVEAVFLARNTDAVAGTAAGIKGGPLFTFGLGGLDDETREEILRLQPKNLVLMGDTSSISIDIGDLLDELADTSLDHVAGVDRYDTAAKLTETTHPFGASVVYVANGIVLADAISGGPAASLENAPVLLVRPHAIPQITVESLRRLKPERIVVLGQTDAVSKEVERRLQEFAPTVERIGGVDRVVTAVAVSQQRFPFGARTIYVTTVDEIDLAGVAVPVASVDRAPVLFSPADCLPTVVRTEIQRLRPTRIVTFGGFAVDDVLGLPDC